MYPNAFRPLSPSEAEAAALALLREGQTPDAEAVLRLLERCSLPPTVVDLVARQLGCTGFRPALVPPDIEDRSLWTPYLRALSFESRQPIDPEGRWPSAAATEAVLAALLEEGGGAGRRILVAHLSRWRERRDYAEAVHRLRDAAERYAMIEALIAAEEAADADAANLALKERFFLQLLERAARRRKQRGQKPGA